jgi:SAM-dependent methyltransferase
MNQSLHTNGAAARTSFAIIGPSAPEKCTEIEGMVMSGRGEASIRLADSAAELKSITNEALIPGSLNVVLDRPIWFAPDRAIAFSNGRWLLWRGWLGGIPVWLFRWSIAPLHVVEILSSIHLRSAFNLCDGQRVRIKLDVDQIRAIPWLARAAWALIWSGRKTWSYSNDAYYYFVRPWGVRLGATQSGGSREVIEMIGARVKSVIKRTPIFGQSAVFLKSAILPSSNEKVSFKRLTANDEKNLIIRQVRNLLNYTKTSGTRYSARHCPAGYHTIELGGHRLEGQRQPAERLALVPFNFRGKTVLDIGCNQGGMLFEICGTLKEGVGIDFDSRMVNAANRIKAVRRAEKVHFFVFDLEKEPLDLILDFLPEERVDIVFLLAVCTWVSNWREVIDFAANISTSMLFETTGTDEQQADQENYLRRLYRNVVLLAGTSEDDRLQKRRRLFYLSDPYATTSNSVQLDQHNDL